MPEQDSTSAASDGSAAPASPDSGGPSTPPPPPATEPTAAQKAYWRANIAFVAVLLVIWFTVSCVCGIFLVDTLNQFHLGGFPLGFWFSQQGAVITFIFLILTYAIGMGMLDRKYGLDLPDAPPSSTDPGTPAAPGADEGAA